MSDFSCYIQITNNSAHDLTANYNAQSGSWQMGLPNLIAAHTTTDYLRLEDPSGSYGSQGSVGLGIAGSAMSLIAYLEDPYSGDNSANFEAANFTPTMSWSFEGATGDPSGFEPDNLPDGGHPVYVNLTFEDSAAA